MKGQKGVRERDRQQLGGERERGGASERASERASKRKGGRRGASERVSKREIETRKGRARERDSAQRCILMHETAKR